MRRTEKNNSIHLIPNDPIYCMIEKFHPYQVWLSTIFFDLLIYFLAGIIINLKFPTQNFVHIQDKAELLNGFNVWVFIIPLVWYWFRWTPQAIMEILQQLLENGLIHKSLNGNDIEQLVSQSFSKKGIYFIGLIGALVYMLFYSLFIKQQNISLGKPDFWFMSNVTFGILLFLIAFAAYLIFTLAFRIIFAFRELAIYFRSTDSIKKIIPLHPDGCGGFSSLGVFCKKALFFVVLGNFWPLIFNFFPVLTGGTKVGPIILIIYSFIFLIVPFFFILPLVFPHKAMKKYKENILLKISGELFILERKMLNNSYTEIELKKDMEKYHALVDIYKTVDEQITTWPITIKSLRNSLITAITPALISLITSIITLIKATIVE